MDVRVWRTRGSDAEAVLLPTTHRLFSTTLNIYTTRSPPLHLQKTTHNIPTSTLFLFFISPTLTQDVAKFEVVTGPREKIMFREA